MYASDLGNDLLSLLGQAGKEDIYYMATHHPQTNETCVFAHYLLSIAIRNINNNNRKHKEGNNENDELKQIAFSRGLFPAFALRDVVSQYIVTGNHREFYENLMANNLVSPIFLIHRNTSTDTLLRFIDAYHKMRRRYFRLSPIDDDGFLNIMGFCYNSDNNLKISGDHKAIYIFFPKKCQRKPSPVFPPRKRKRKNGEVLHNSELFPKLAYLYQNLNKVYTLSIYVTPSNLIGHCQCLDTITSFNGLYARNDDNKGPSVIYHKPKGLLGLCIDHIQRQFKWKPWDLKKELPISIIELYFQ